MGTSTRRRFVQQSAFTAAALCTRPAQLIAGVREVVAAGTQNEAPLDPAEIRALASKITGALITPETPSYDTARVVFNLAFDRHPALIARCADGSDVARVLEFAQHRNLPLAVRSGGHSRLAYGMCDGGVVIDLSGMRRVEVDAGKRVARAQAGVIVRELDEATQHFGLATTSGGCPTVGIAGFTLGGGEGRLMEKFGAACDNLLSAQMVTVDGRQIVASEESNVDLFWAIRGGGGNFGIVTALEYRLHPVGQVVSGPLTYAAGRIPELLQGFTKFLAEAPDELDAFAQLLPSPQGARFKIDVCYCGDPRLGNDIVRPLRALKPQEDGVRAMSYLEAQAAGGFLLSPVAHFQTNVILSQISESASAAITSVISHAPVTCKLIIVPLRGAVTRVSSNAMAFALRQPGYEIDITGVWKTPDEKAVAVRWVEATRDVLQPFAHAVYVNQLGDTSDRLVRSAYGTNFDRLAEIKKQYDPKNVLRLNQNIQPS